MSRTTPADPIRLQWGEARGVSACGGARPTRHRPPAAHLSGAGGCGPEPCDGDPALARRRAGRTSCSDHRVLTSGPPTEDSFLSAQISLTCPRNETARIKHYFMVFYNSVFTHLIPLARRVCALTFLCRACGSRSL